MKLKYFVLLKNGSIKVGENFVEVIFEELDNGDIFIPIISEEDFKLRGHGDLFGTKQSGDMTFKIANIRQDYKILLQAKKDSKEYLLDKETDNDELKKMLIGTIAEG